MAASAKREAIAVAARNEFSEMGYHGARLERIADSARANKQLIFHYFGSKDGLYGAVVSSVLEGAPTAVGSGASPMDTLRRHAADVATWFATTPGAALLLSECLSGREMPASAVSAARKWLDTEQSMLRSIVNDGQSKGHFRDDIDLRLAEQLLVSVCVGHSLLARSQAVRDSGTSGLATLLGMLLGDYCSWR